MEQIFGEPELRLREPIYTWQLSLHAPVGIVLRIWHSYAVIAPSLFNALPWHISYEKNFNVAKCNLGKVNLEAMLVSSFPSYTRGGRCL